MNLNEFANLYYSNFVYPPVPLDPKETALVLIDVQDCLTKDYYEKFFKMIGQDVDALAPVLDELGAYVDEKLENIGKVLSACRSKGIRPIHVKIESYLPDAADTGRLHAAAGLKYPPGTPECEFLEFAKPAGNEIVLKKTCSGIHVGTPIDRILRNLGIKNVIIVGFYTDQCVSTSVRDLADLGYVTGVVEDAIGAFSPERHEKALLGFKNIYAAAETTESLLSRLAELK
ncbi:MAG TPA: isochorismatase family cysteine hydrolase [Anaerovoracaceae bacterium]|nr:isochorismatase family cysteine hydrolase [Anaerovoracaceae bacterium]